MDTVDFINKVSAGDALGAKEGLNNLLSSRAFDALGARKVELAQSIFGGLPDVEVQDSADTEVETEE